MELNKVHSDSRRTISVISGLLDGDKEFSIIELKPGKACGGCKHSNDENFIILRGNVLVFINDERMKCREGYNGMFYAGDVHGFYSEKGATIVEYGITEKEKLNNKKDKKMLKEIKAINGS